MCQSDVPLSALNITWMAWISHVSDKSIPKHLQLHVVYFSPMRAKFSKPLFSVRLMILIHTLLLIVDPNKYAAELVSSTGKAITTDDSENQRTKHWALTAGGSGRRLCEDNR
jgi:hypothetical protein